MSRQTPGQEICRRCDCTLDWHHGRRGGCHVCDKCPRFMIAKTPSARERRRPRRLPQSK